MVRSIGAHDVFTALVAEQAGIDALFVGGFGASASLLGLPDAGLITLSEMAALVRRIAARVSIPVVADGDTGYGGVHNVARTVEEFESGGAAGVVLEDQVSPKRCGHFQGKSVIPAADMVLKLKAACAARKNKEFLIIARTDARDVHGLADAIKRANLYRRAGADVAFIESPATEKELAVIPKKVKGPLLVNMLTGGKTPNLHAQALEKMGYAIVVYPIESLMLAAQAITHLTGSIMGWGSVERVSGRMESFASLKKILGADQLLEQGRPYGRR